MMKAASALALMSLTGACAAGPRWANGEPPVLVKAALETVVTSDGQVDADDPAFWADSKDTSRALMFGTDKTDGLYVHNMDGTVRQFFPSGALNNVDLRTGFMLGGKEYVLVGASADEKLGLYTYLLDPATLETKEWGFATTGDFEPYGFCLARKNDQFYLIADAKSGEIRIWTVSADAAGKPVTTLVRTLKVGSQPEGCVVDEETDTLYVGEEDVGIWKFGFSVGKSETPVSVAKVDKKRLTDDTEGLTIMRDGAHKYLIASSQGDDTYNVFRLADGAETYVGRFAIVDGDVIDGVTATDGVDAWSGPIGQFPEGVLGFHDDQDAPMAGQQNYKMVDWRDVRAALGLPK